MSPYSVLVTGANRGIGLALVKEFLKRKDIQVVIATARDPAKADVRYFLHNFGFIEILVSERNL